MIHNDSEHIDLNRISDRIKNIQELCKQSLNSLIDFTNCNQLVKYPNNVSDIRYLLDKKYLDFSKAIHQLGGKLIYIKSGSTGHTFRGVYPPTEQKKSYAVKIVAYPKKENYGGMYDSKRPENTEILMIKLLSYFVINKQTPHIILPITTFNTSIKPFLNLAETNVVNNKKYDQFIEKYKRGEYYQNVSILISEWANGGDLLDFLKKNYKKISLKEWKALFFQIISVLAVIQSKYPEFRHNDMKANNILVHKINIDKNNKDFLYKINNQIYVVPNIGIQLKLWDFDFACIPSVVNNSKVNAEWTDRINIKPEQNRYYDIHYFFNTLIRQGFIPELLSCNEIPYQVVDFIHRIIPDKYKSGPDITDRGRILCNDEFKIPDNIIKNDTFFRSFRKKS